MHKTVCFSCGQSRDFAHISCPSCGTDYSINELYKAYSIRLSTKYFDQSIDEYLDEQDLERISKEISVGGPYEFIQVEIDELIEEKKLLDHGLGFSNWIRIVLFLGLLLLPFTVALYMYFRIT